MNSSLRAEEPESFPSEVDWWVGVILVLAPAVTLAVLVVSVVAGEGIGGALLSFALVVGLYAGLVFPLRYSLEREDLVVRFGFVQRRIPYTQIRSVRPTRSPLSSPALSLSRLRVQYGEGFFSAVMISPKPREDFLTALAKRTGLELRGDSLGPRSREG